MKNEKMIYIIAIALAVVINAFSLDLPFFWDTILTSTITQYFFENGLQNLITPSQFDAGHPPLFYFYITCFYHLLGKSLFAAHVAMLPFTLLGILSFIKILKHFQFAKGQQYLGLILFFSIPAVITQYCMISYDAVLLSLYLSALLCILKNKKILLSIILIVIVGVSLRGLFCLASLSVTVFFLENKNIKLWLKWNLYFIPSLLIITIWIYYHYTQTGWFLSTNTDAWSEQRGIVNAFGVFKNSVSIARCFFDVGIIILSLLSIFYFMQKRKFDHYTLFWLIPFIIFSIAFLPFKNPINHRYFLIVYVLMLFPVIQFLGNKKAVYTVITVCILILGHFLIYPVPVSNGWDCTLEQTSYTKARDDFFNSYVRDFHVDRFNIGTVFPMDASRKQTDMMDDTIRMINVNGRSMDSIPYVLFSNVGNDFSDEQIQQLKNWTSVYQTKKGLVELILFRNPNFHSK